MADATVTFLLENVTRILKSYIDLIADAKVELRMLEEDLDLLKGFLEEEAAKPKEEETYRRIVRQIREVVYDVEDTIDTCLTEAAAAASKDKNWIRRWFNPKRVGMAKQVKAMREGKVKRMFDQARLDFAKMNAAGGLVEQQRMRRLKKVPLFRQDNVVGFIDQEEILLNYLREKKDELDVISIIGMPGLGKTTLAWKIFKDKQIEYEFQIRIWINVSQELNHKDVLLNIVRAFTDQDVSGYNDHDLIQIARDYLSEGKFLLVLDDVWTVEDWDIIQNFLPKGNDKGKVLITSRDKKVGKHANVAREPHALRFLNSDESWELLQLEVFGKGKACPRGLKERGEIIANECGGLPLALVVIGGILVEKYSEPVNNGTVNAWKAISENVSAYVKNDKKNSISKIVALSYNNLPNDLRDCFLYLAVFPEDYEIPVWTLTRLWIAEGFIQHKEEESLEETAEENLKDLINRNLVMVKKINPDGQVKTCSVHDVIHVFCSSKAAEQNLFREIKMTKHGVFDPEISNIKNYRRLSIHSSLSKFLSKRPEGRGIRSFLCFNKEPKYWLEPKYKSTIFAAFNLLRILDSKSFTFKGFPIKITELIHLRYITLSCDDLDVLPKEMSRLWNLQTLVVDTSSYSLKVETNIWKMIQLRHLKTEAAIVLTAQEGGEVCENLQTLSRLSPEHCNEGVFDRAPNLKRLGIRGQLAKQWDWKSLRKLEHLDRLKLVNDLVYGSAYENRLHSLPRAIDFPKNLKRLTLSATFLDWRYMSTLGGIDTLQVLKLKENAFDGMSWNVAGGGFQSLQFLLLESKNLVSWVASSGDFPQLACLVLNNCKKLGKIPLCLEENLRMLNLTLVSKSVVTSAREIEDIKKQQQQQQQQQEKGGFKLTIGPGCE